MSSRGSPENVLRTSQINLPGTSLDVISGHSWNVRSGCPGDGKTGSLGDVLRTLEGNLLGTSLGPIFAGWEKCW